MGITRIVVSPVEIGSRPVKKQTDGFARQLQEMAGGVLSVSDSPVDKRAAKLSDIASRYDLNNLTLTESEQLAVELSSSGLLPFVDASNLVPVERGLDRYGHPYPQEVRDRMRVDVADRLQLCVAQYDASDQPAAAASARRALAFFEELLQVRTAAWQPGSGFSTSA